MEKADYQKALIGTGLTAAILVAAIAGGVFTETELEKVYFCEDRADISFFCNSISGSRCYLPDGKYKVCRGETGWQHISLKVDKNEPLPPVITQQDKYLCDDYKDVKVCHLE